MNYLNKYILYSPAAYGGGSSNVATPSFKITGVTISKKDKFIKPRGEKRKIKITGTVGSTFSLDIKNSSDCCILKEEIQNVKIPKKGVYILEQEFPSISTSKGHAKTREVYDIIFTPGADVELLSINATTPFMQIYQYADPIITVTNSFTAATIGGNIDVTATDVTMTGPANTYSDDISNYSTTTYTLTVTNTDGTGSFYVKNYGFDNNITANTVIKKRVNRNGETGLTDHLTLKHLTTRIDTTIEGNDSVPIGGLEEKMRLSATVTKTKTVKASYDKNDKILDHSKCSTISNKIELSDTQDLVVGMRIVDREIRNATIVAIDCDKKITLSKKYLIKPKTELTFEKKWRVAVQEIISQNNENGEICIRVNRPIDIPNGTEVEFDDNDNVISGKSVISGNGSDSVVITTTLKAVKFGLKNVTYTLDLDKIVTREPDTRDKEIDTKGDTAVVVRLLDEDREATVTRVGSIVRNPSHGTLGGFEAATGSFQYTPHDGFKGEDSFTFRMVDGGTYSKERTVRVTIK